MPKFRTARFATPLIMVLIFSLAGCASRQPAGDTATLPGLQKMAFSRKDSKKASIGAIRRKAIHDMALSLGAQGGLAERTQELNALLTQKRHTLDGIFDFRPLLLAHNILPPVLVTGDHSLNLANEQAIRLADRSYQIISQARFVTNPPNWRDYLWQHFTPPPPPDPTLRPHNRQEREIWLRSIHDSWQRGRHQADTIFAQNLRRLARDMKGMVIYRQLLAKNMVTPPYVAKTQLGITGDTQHIRINDQVLRISALPGLNINSRTWKPALSFQKNAHLLALATHAK